MLKPYSVLDENETHITYKYDPRGQILLYGSFLILVVAMSMEILPLALLAIAGFIVYFIFVLFPAMKFNAILKQSISSHSATVSGEKWSKKNPMTIKMLKTRR